MDVTGVKFAVTDCGPSIAIVVEVLPAEATRPVQFVKRKPFAGVAASATLLPAV